MEFTQGDDASHCANGLNAKRFREASEEERAAYRSWLRGIVFFYCGLLFISGVAIATYSGTGRTQLSNLSAHQIAKSMRSD
jgi:hypothetical protein